MKDFIKKRKTFSCVTHASCGNIIGKRTEEIGFGGVVTVNKIRFIANKDTNYVFHMLSVSKCGYDNKYGEYYRPLYPKDDLALLKNYEKLITVCGGEYCGALYGILVCNAACAKVSAKEYYSELMQRAADDDLPNDLAEYGKIICRISAIMIKHYDYFIENIWEKERRKIDEYIPTVQRLFDDSNFAEKAEKAVGCKLPQDFFTATLVTSIEDGAEAIDITDEQDVFGIERDPIDAFYFIGHEFIIYLLFSALKDENAFKEFNTWDITEGLAEYYLKQILGDTRFFNSHKKYVEFFEEATSAEKSDAVELYRKGLSAF